MSREYIRDRGEIIAVIERPEWQSMVISRTGREMLQCKEPPSQPQIVAMKIGRSGAHTRDWKRYRREKRTFAGRMHEWEGWFRGQLW